MPRMRAAVVGHVEWLEFVPVESVPRPGEIVHASESWEQAAGGGSVAAVQLAQLADSVDFFTALGNDERGSAGTGRARGPRHRPCTRRRSTRRSAADSHSSTTRASGRSRRSAASSIRAATTRRSRGTSSRGATPCTSAQATPTRSSSHAEDGCSSPRRVSSRRSGRRRCELDALVSSGKDEAELYHPGQLDPEPRLVVTTSGALGGWAQPGGPYNAAPLPPDPADAYGAGDCFAAGLAFALAAGLDGLEALEFAARCGAGALAGPGVHAEVVPLP